MSKPFTYWVRLALVATLCTLVTFSPVSAGRWMDRLLHRDGCKPAAEGCDPEPACLHVPALPACNVSSPVVACSPSAAPSPAPCGAAPTPSSAPAPCAPPSAPADCSCDSLPMSAASSLTTPSTETAPATVTPSAPAPAVPAPAAPPTSDTPAIKSPSDSAVPPVAPPTTNPEPPKASQPPAAPTSTEPANPFDSAPAATQPKTNVEPKVEPASEAPTPTPTKPDQSLEELFGADKVPEAPTTTTPSVTEPPKTDPVPEPKLEELFGTDPAKPAAQPPETTPPAAALAAEDPFGSPEPAKPATESPVPTPPAKNSEPGLDDLFNPNSPAKPENQVPGTPAKEPNLEELFGKPIKTGIGNSESASNDDEFLNSLFGSKADLKSTADETAPVFEQSNTPAAPEAEISVEKNPTVDTSPASQEPDIPKPQMADEVSLDQLFGVSAANPSAQPSVLETESDERPAIDALFDPQTTVEETPKIDSSELAVEPKASGTLELESALMQPETPSAQPATADSATVEPVTVEPVTVEPAPKPAASEDTSLDALFGFGTNSAEATSVEPAKEPVSVPADEPKSDEKKPAATTEDDIESSLDRLFGISAVTPSPKFEGADFREWVDNTGAYAVKARLAVIYSDKVKLLKENGKYTTVPLSRLSDADFGYVQWVATSLTSDNASKMVKKETPSEQTDSTR